MPDPHLEVNTEKEPTPPALSNPRFTFCLKEVDLAAVRALYVLFYCHSFTP